MTQARLEYRAQPSALRFMAWALRGPRRFGADGRLPAIEARWKGHRATRHGLKLFLALSGLPERKHLPILYPHAVSFPMQLAVLCHPSFPVRIWNILQVRNRLTQHVALPREAPFDLEVAVGERRVLEKGVEIDMRVEARLDGATAWAGVTTFYARGRFGIAEAPVQPPASPAVEGPLVARWRMPAHGRWRYGRLIGDFNGIHMSDWYARRFGFARAFSHPHRVLGQCLSHLGADLDAAPLAFDAWIKGPVFYGAQLSLRASGNGEGKSFALHVDDDARPAMIGRLA
jgi:hypothetical protein